MTTFSDDMMPVQPVLGESRAFPASVESAPGVLPQPPADAVAAFQAAMGSLVADNRKVQAALEKAVPLPLEVPVPAPEAKPAVVAEAKPPAVLAPEVVREFAEVIAPLVTENREVQVALEKAVPLPLEVPVPAPEAKPAVVAEAKPPAVLTPEVVREFAEVIAPLVTENREVLVALEKAVPLPLEVPVRTPEAKPAVVAEAKPAVVAEAKPAVVAEAKPAVVAEAKPAMADGDEVPGGDLPDVGVVLQAAPVGPQPQIDAAVRPEASPIAVDGVSAAVAAQRSAPTPSEVLIAAAEAVADTIMVTPDLLTGNGQVRVQLRPDVLDGTEIQINVTGRTIAVDFLPQTADIAALIQRSLPQLEQHLASRIHSFTIAATVGATRRRKA